jgi:hypothetical protein
MGHGAAAAAWPSAAARLQGGEISGAGLLLAIAGDGTNRFETQICMFVSLQEGPGLASSAKLHPPSCSSCAAGNCLTSELTKCRSWKTSAKCCRHTQASASAQLPAWWVLRRQCKLLHCGGWWRALELLMAVRQWPQSFAGRRAP